MGYLPHLNIFNPLVLSIRYVPLSVFMNDLRLTQLNRSECVCLPAVVAVEVIRVVGVILKQQRSLIYNGVTLLTDVLAKAPSFLSVVTWTAQVPDGKEKEKYRKVES